MTETVFALGEGARVVGVDVSSVYPPEATRLPQLGYQRTLSAEGILAQAPDLVIASEEAGPPAALEQLRAAGVEVAIIPSAMTPEAAATRIQRVGEALNASPRATTLATTLVRDVGEVRARIDPTSRPDAIVIYTRGAGTLMVAGEGTTAAAMLELAGARNAARGFTGYKALSPELLVAAAPQVIIIPARGLALLGGEAGLLAVPGVAATPAGQRRRFVALDDLLLLGFGPRLASAIDQLASAVRGS